MDSVIDAFKENMTHTQNSEHSFSQTRSVLLLISHPSSSKRIRRILPLQIVFPSFFFTRALFVLILCRLIFDAHVHSKSFRFQNLKFSKLRLLAGGEKRCSANGKTLTFETVVLMCLFGVLNLEWPRLFGV